MHLDEDLAAPPGPDTSGRPRRTRERWRAKLCAWGVGVNKQVVVYDDSYGAMATRLWWMMRWLGHPGVALLDGGYPKWVRENRPVNARNSPVAAPRCVCLSAGTQPVS